MKNTRRVLGLIFFGVMLRDIMRVAMMILLGIFLASGLPSIPVLLLASASMVSNFMYANIVNDIYDIELDRKAKAYRPLPSGRYSVAEARTASAVFLLIALFSGAWATLASGDIRLCVLLLLTLFACHFYSGPPIRFKGRSWLGVISISAIYLSPLVMGWLVGGLEVGNSPIPVLMFLAIFLASGTKDFEDVDVDAAMGVVTPPVRYGIERTAALLRCTSMVAGSAAIMIAVAYLLLGYIPQGSFSIALVPSFAIYAKRMAIYASCRSRDALVVLVKGCLWTMYVWPFAASVITLLMPRVLGI